MSGPAGDGGKGAHCSGGEGAHVFLGRFLDCPDLGVDVDAVELHDGPSTFEHLDDGFGRFNDAGHVEEHVSERRCPGVQTCGGFADLQAYDPDLDEVLGPARCDDLGEVSLSDAEQFRCPKLAVLRNNL
ncbi:hypothetical protein [Mycolicibacterium fortuitum]|uniref:hypothetical protein n=1 Tax=Mycolicibacterium fortuitum TaxID=1766 RepID=UPI003AAF2CA5